MKVFIGTDHRGVAFKKKIKGILMSLKMDVVDLGAFDESKSCDYPKIAFKVATSVAGSRNARGVLLCMSGIGQSIAANKVAGVRAALCHNIESAKLSRQHNNANILVIGSKFVKQKDLKKMISTWFFTEFEAGRHQRRVNQIKKIEQGKRLR